MTVSSRIPYIATVVPGDWSSLMRFTRDVQKYLAALSKSDQSATFTTLTLTDLTASRLVATDSTSTLESTDLNSWVSGTTNQITVTDDSDGTITLSTPQDIDTACDFQANTIQLDAGTWQIVDLLNIDNTNYNVFLGPDVFANDNGQYNVGIGYQAGYYNNVTGVGYEGTRNLYIGYLTGYGVPAGSSARRNVGLGSYALTAVESAYDNVAIGESALRTVTIGYRNVAIGIDAMRGTTSGYTNIAIGDEAGYNISTGYGNTYIGYDAGHYTYTGVDNVGIGRVAIQGTVGHSISRNVGIGVYTGLSLQTNGNNNVFIGYESGRLLTTGDSNVFLGYDSGKNQTTNSNLLIIDNQDRTSVALELSNSLLYGVFDAASANQSLRVNGYLIAKEAIKILERSSDPSQPSEGECVIWMSDGTGYGDDGDICAASTAGGNTKKAIIFDFSAGDAW